MFGFLFRKHTIKREIIVNAEALETRVAILENGKLEEFQVEHPMQARVVGSVYKGRIQNLEHDLQAAFVDIGLRKNAFLHYWDMMPDSASMLDLDEDDSWRNAPRKKRFSREEMNKRFPPGSEVVIQITKAAIGNKGPRATTSVSIPGRYLVLIPGSNLRGVSRKIEDAKERESVRKVLHRLPLPENTGLIARTAAASVSKRSLARDLRGLISTWTDVRQAIQDKPSPCCLYQEPDLVERVVRDWLTEDVDRIVVDSPREYERIVDVASRISRRARSRVQLYEGDLPVFEHHDVERQLREAYQRKVDLKCGGYIVFDETEAMVVIDVNSGRYKGKGTQEDAILEVNTEAVEEVTRQLRLRNVGGLVAIDLIDMKSRRHQHAVYRAMRTALRRDRARTNVLPISPLGILEMTRQRVEESITTAMYVDCPYCQGRGNVKSPLRMSVEIQRQVHAILRRQRKVTESPHLLVVVHPTVLERLRSKDEEILLDLETKYGSRLSFKSDPAKHMEHFVIADAATNEVLYTNK